MSKQPLKVVKKLREPELLLPPNSRDPRQLWLLVRQEPMDNSPGCFFVTHGRNYDKFNKRKGFEVLAHSFDRFALTIAARQATLAAGPNYQPKFSAHRQPLTGPAVGAETEPEVAPGGIIDPTDIVL